MFSRYLCHGPQMEILRTENPITLFQKWLADAAKTEPNDPEAVALATVDAEGMPSVRMVLMKKADNQGFRFFTNMESNKGQQLTHNHNAALCFHWKSLLRQVRVWGKTEVLTGAESDAYFQSRHPVSRLGAWASAQSRPLDSRETLEAEVAEYAQKFGDDILRPPHWGGYLLKPERIEFWQQGDNRLHDRFLFTRKDDGWDLTRLNP